MASPPFSGSLTLRLTLPSDHPQLLAGLEQWLQLGLISPTWLVNFCGTALTCPLPERALVLPPFPDFSPGLAPDLADVPSGPSRPVLPRRPWQGIWEELGVVWLLAVGVFLVVVSSGVLAIAQWQVASPTGQYSILWFYTLAFWQLGRWCARQPRLRLTSRTLQNLTLWVIPLNFWALGSLGVLGQGLWGLVIAGAAITSLMVITRQLIGPSWVGLWGLLGLVNGLHWGWRVGSSWGPLGLGIGAGLGAWALLWPGWRSHRRGAIALTLGLGFLIFRSWVAPSWGVGPGSLALGLLGWGWVGRSLRSEGESISQRSGGGPLGGLAVAIAWGAISIRLNPLAAALWGCPLGLAGFACLRDRGSRLPHGQRLLWLHGIILVTLLQAWNGWGRGTDTLGWGLFLGSLALGEWAWSWARRWKGVAQQVSWYLGLGLAGISGVGLLTTGQSWALLWWAIPITLILGNRVLPPPRQRENGVMLGVFATVIGVGLGTFAPWGWIGGAVVAALLTALGHRQCFPAGAALPAIALGWLLLAYLGAANAYGSGPLAAWGLGGLWVLLGLAGIVRRWQGMAQVRHPLLTYGPALDGWGIALGTVLLWSQTISLLARDDSLLSPWHEFGLTWPWLAALLGAIALRLMQGPTPWLYIGLAWAVELLLAAGVRAGDGGIPALALGNLTLALVSTALGRGLRWWRLQRRRRGGWSARRGWRVTAAVIPLAYGLLALLLGHLTIGPLTGFYTVGLGGVAMAVGRRYRPWQPLTGLGILAAGVGAYELLIYQLQQQPGGATGDGLTLLGGLGGAIALGIYLGQGFLGWWWRWSAIATRRVAHSYWFLASGFTGLAQGFDLSATGHWLWLGIATGLSLYALWQGKLSVLWANLALTTLTLTVFFALLAGDRGPWLGSLTAAIATLLLLLPWPRWGYSRRPWAVAAQVLPITALWISLLVYGSDLPALQYLLVGGFYGGLALHTQRIRLSYLAVGLGNLALLEQFGRWGWPQGPWMILLLGATGLYIAQVDPRWQGGDRRQQRHWVRLLAVGLIAFAALREAGFQVGAMVGVMGLGLGGAIAGLILRVRAYLYGGTILFALEVLRFLWRFVGQNALLLWAVGLSLGLAFIWLAATFESRRQQIHAWRERWAEQWDDWA